MVNVFGRPLGEDSTRTWGQTLSPSNRLMLAVLEEALLTFQKGLNSPSAERRRRSCDADRWIQSRDARYLFSFANICSSLKVDPGYLRKGLRRLKSDALEGKERCKPTGLRREQMVDRRAWRGRIG